MKKYKINKLILLSLFTFLPLFCISQSIDREKVYELGKKARKGKLAYVEQVENKDYKLYYITKASSKKAKVDVYRFDKDFNFKEITQEEILFEKMKLKFDWFNFNGELYTVEGTTVSYNPAFPLKLKKKRITYKYDWLFLGYYKTVEILEKVKPRTDDGMKYYCFKYMEDEITGDLYIVAGAAPGGLDKNAGNRLTDIRLLKFDKDLNKVAETKVTFEFGQEVAFAQPFAEADPENPEALGIVGGALVFAPNEWKGSSAPKDKNKGNFTYVEFDKDLKLVARESFTSPSPGWSMDGASWIAKSDGTKDVYIYGAAALGKDKYHMYAVQSAKKKSIQVLKVNSGKIDYLTETSLEEIENAKKLPASNKKTVSYTGKQKLVFQFAEINSGNIILYSQYYSKEGIPQDYTALEYDQSGKLVANYMRNMELQPKVKMGINHTISENKNGVFWTTFEVDETKSVASIAPVISKIDVKMKTFGEPLLLGKVGKKPTYFVDQSFPMLNISNTQQVYFGSDKSGKNIWFCRVNLD
ncbi:MAG: hypothetical protein AB8B74_05060 [Crocinitomicaceae bacterium]